jgi:O-antigen ligase
MSQSGKQWSWCFALLLALFFVAYPLVSGVAGAFDVYSRALSVVIRAGVAFLALALVARAVFQVPAPRWTDAGLWAMFLLWICLLIRLGWDSSVVPIPLPLPWFENLVVVIGISFLPALALVHAPDEAAFDRARRLLAMLGTISAVAIAYTVVKLLTNPDSLIVYSRLGTEFLNPISIGHLGVTLIAVTVLSTPVSGSGGVTRLLDSLVVRILISIISVVLVVGSNSKGPIISLLAVFLVWACGYSLRRSDPKAAFKALAAMFAMIVVFLAIALTISSLIGVNIFQRFDFGGGDRSTAERVMLMSNALAQFESSPLVGDSFVESVLRFYPHNMAVDTLMTTGLIGFGLYFALLLFCAGAGLRVLRTRHSWLTLMYVQMTVASMFSGAAYFDPFFWGSSAMLLAADRLLKLNARPCELAPQLTAAPTGG